MALHADNLKPLIMGQILAIQKCVAERDLEAAALWTNKDWSVASIALGLIVDFLDSYSLNRSPRRITSNIILEAIESIVEKPYLNEILKIADRQICYRASVSDEFKSQIAAELLSHDIWGGIIKR